jgi:hypothetical protein
VRPDAGGDDGGLKAVIQRRSVKLLPGVRMREDEIVGAILARLMFFDNFIPCRGA